jgi:exopolyphosphatase/guanosine-5'-triphosphate,3'-diphosphate pyrophosphatase
VSAPAGCRIAVVDVGSNSVRLFLCDGIDAEGPVGERFTTVTGLRRGAGADGAVAADALARLDDCLAGYAGRIEPFAADRVAAVATSAVRDAPNRHEVGEVVRRRLGARMRVLTGAEEAQAAFAGARLAAEGEGPILVLDVGGGSTELVRGGPAGPEGAVSLQLGAVRQTERHLRADPPEPAGLEALRAEALGLLRPAVEAVGGAAPAVGVAGTVTSLAAIEIGRYDRALVHRHRLTRAAVEAMARRLAAMPVHERREVPGLDPARAGVIVAGAVIVAAAMDAAGRQELMVSETDLLDGVALAAAGRPVGSFRL